VTAQPIETTIRPSLAEQMPTYADLLAKVDQLMRENEQLATLIVLTSKPAHHWQVYCKDGSIHDFPEAAECHLGQAWGVGPWAYRLTGSDGSDIAGFPIESVRYVKRV
jgi:hypothetical protein